MIVCRKCSRRHADGTEFCACGAFLEFDGERIADPPASVSTGAGAAPSVPAPDAPWSTPTPSVGSGGADEPDPWSGFDSDARTSGSSTTASRFDAQLPDAPVTPPSSEPVWIEPTARAGDVACRQCGTPNSPDRQFCHHCGQPLTVVASTVAEPGEKIPWWRRFGRKAKARTKRTDPMAVAMTAQRVSRGGVGWRSVAFRTGGVLVLVVGLLALLGPWRGKVVARAKDVMGAERYEVLEEGEVEASAAASSPAIAPEEFPLQPPENVLDRYANTAWATRWLVTGGTGASEVPAGEECIASAPTDSFLRFTFDEADLARVRILGGRHAEDERRTVFPRPRIVELRVGEACRFVELPDDGALFQVDFEHDNVDQVELRVLGIYPGEEPSATVEISAVVFERGR